MFLQTIEPIRVYFCRYSSDSNFFGLVQQFRRNLSIRLNFTNHYFLLTRSTMTIDLLIFLLYSPPIFILHPIYIKFNFEMKNHTPFFQLLLIKIKQNFAFPFNHSIDSHVSKTRIMKILIFYTFFHNRLIRRQKFLVYLPIFILQIKFMKHNLHQKKLLLQTRNPMLQKLYLPQVFI